MRNYSKRFLAALLSASLLFGGIPIHTAAKEEQNQFTVEAEDRVRGRGNVNPSGTASGGKYLGDFYEFGYSSYEINVETAGNYKVLMGVATINDGGQAMLNCGGYTTEIVSVPNTGGWQSYQDIELHLWLEAGKQTVTIVNTKGTWNIDKMDFSWQDSERTEKNPPAYEGVYLENRWKSQRIAEKNGEASYADPGASEYNSKNSLWKLIPDELGWYTIQNAESGKCFTMTEGTQIVSLADEETLTDAGKWRVGKINDFLIIYNKQYNDCGLNLEGQGSDPGKVFATNDAGPAFFSVQWKFNVPAQYHEYTIGAETIEGTAGTATATDGNSITVQKNGTGKTWTLSQDISNEPIFKAPSMPMMEAVYNLTMEESLLNIHEGTYGDVFWTGANWSGQVWTRDTAMSVQYSLGWVFPEESQNSLLQKVIGAEGNPKIWEEDTGTGGSYATSIDRIIMEIAGWEIYKTTGNEEFLEQIYNISKNTLEQDYHVAYDELTGLFKGETGGLDHCAKTYPDWMDPDQKDSIVNIAEGKPANANIIFAQALHIMAESGKILGKEESEIADWEAKYEDLKKAINEHFWLEDRGMYASWEYPEWMGSPVADKVDVIANGYAVMFDIADEQQKKQIMENYPLVVYGANTVWPQKNGLMASTIYHNRGVWPGWEATMMIAAKENGNMQLAEEIMKSCVRGAAINLSNKEVIHFESGDGYASDRQLWSVAGTLAGYYRVLFGMEYEPEGISFQPYVPEWMEGPYSLSNYKYRDAVLNLTVEGKGDTLTSITVNGDEKPLDYILPVDAQGTYQIVMTVADSGNRSSVHIEEDSWAVCPDLPVLTEQKDGTLTWKEEEGYTYKLWTGKKFEEVSGGSYVPSRDIYAAYSLVAVDENGITSEMSKPVVVSPENTKTLYEAEDGEYAEGNFEASAKGFTGTGYVIDRLAHKTDLRITVNAPLTGRYQLSMVYNNLGDGGNSGGIRSVYVDGKDAGTLIFPTVKMDFQRSTHMFLNLTEGEHTIDIFYNKDDWYDTNMGTSKNYKKNDVCYDSLTLQYLADGVAEQVPQITVDAPVRGESTTDAKVTVSGTDVECKASLVWTSGLEDAGTEFAANTSYTANITLTLPEGYVFASNAIPTSITSAGETLPLAEGAVRFNSLHTAMTIQYTFAATEGDEKLLLSVIYDAYSSLDLGETSVYTKESREALKNALDAAKLILEDREAKEKEIRQSASGVLAAAIGLELDASDLDRAINEAKDAAEAAKGVAETAKQMAENHETEIESIKENANLAKQAADNLQKQVDALQAEMMKAILAVVHNAYKDMDTSGYTQASAKQLTDALDAAEKILAKDAADMASYTQAAENIMKAAAGLALDTSDLEKAINAAAQAAQTADSVARNAQTLAGNNQTLLNEVKGTAEEAKKAADNLQKQVDALQKDTMKAMLAIVYNVYKDMDTSSYTATSAKLLTDALKAAAGTLANENADIAAYTTATEDMMKAAAGLMLDTSDLEAKAVAAKQEAEAANKLADEASKAAVKNEEAARLAKEAADIADKKAAEAEKAAQEAKEELEKVQKDVGAQKAELEQLIAQTAAAQKAAEEAKAQAEAAQKAAEASDVDKVYYNGNFFYKVTDAEKRTVQLIGMKNSALKKVIVPGTVTLGGKTYQVTSIGKAAFKGNRKMTRVVIGKYVQNIESKAFYNCKNLKKMTFKGKTLKKVGKNALKGIRKNAVIKVPEAQYKSYKNLLSGKGQKKSVKITK